MKKRLLALVLLVLLPGALATDTATTRLNLVVDMNCATNTTGVWVWTNASVVPQKCEPPYCNIIIPRLGTGTCDYDDILSDIADSFDILKNNTRDIKRDLNTSNTLLTTIDGKVLTNTHLSTRMDLFLSDSGIQIQSELADQEKRLQKIFSDANQTHQKDLQIKDVESRYSLCSGSLTSTQNEVERLEGTVEGMNWALGLCLFVVLVFAIMLTNAGMPIRRFLNMG